MVCLSLVLRLGVSVLFICYNLGEIGAFLLLMVQNCVEVHRKRMGDLVPFSPRTVPEVCQSKDWKQTAKVLYLTYRSNPV
jgi:hypothetical protein